MPRPRMSARVLGVFACCLIFPVAAMAQTSARAASGAAFLAALRAEAASGARFLSRPAERARRRNGFQRLLSTASGLTQTGDAGDIAPSGIVSSNGQRPTSNAVSLDGIPASLGIRDDDSSLAFGPGLLPALTAYGGAGIIANQWMTSEVEIATMSIGQRTSGASVAALSRSGTNAFRGGVGAAVGNEVLNANEPFAKALGFGRAPSRMNQFGGSFGGPVVRDRAWFFVAYDGLRLRRGAFAQTEVPTDAARLAAAPSLRAVLDAFPRANRGATGGGFGLFAATYALPAAHDIFSARVDFQPVDTVRVDFRTRVAESKAATRGGASGDYALSTLRRADERFDALTGGANWTASPTVLVQGRVDYARNRVGRALALDAFGGATPFQTNGGDLLRYDFAARGAALATGGRISSLARQLTAFGTVSVVAGRHVVTAGGNYRRIALEPGVAAFERSVLFGGLAPTTSGTAARIVEVRRAPPVTRPETRDLSFFVREDFRVFPRLTLNFGLNADAEFRAGYDGPTSAAFSTRIGARGPNFSPRVAGTYDPLGNGRTILRGGATLYRDYVTPFVNEASAESFPFATAAYAFDAAANLVPTTALRPLVGFDANLRTPRVWHLYAEVQQIVTSRTSISATFTTSLGRDLLRTRTVADAPGGFAYARLTTSDGRSRFDSLQVRLERRLSQGVAVNARYAFQRSRDDFSPDAMRDAVRASGDRAGDRGPSDFDVRHQFAASAVLEIPLFFAAGWKKALTEDWSLSVLASARTARPVGVGIYRYGTYGREFVRADAVAGAPFYIGEGDARTLSVAAFAVPPAARQGTLARGAVRGLGLGQLDARLLRRIRVTNEMRFELTLQALNLLNTVNPADPSGILGAETPSGAFVPNRFFGRPASTSGAAGFGPFNLYGGPRTLQAGVRFVF